MEAIILAGGMGTRLRSLVKDIPKPMADIAGSPFLSYLLQYCSENGVNHVVLAVGYKHEIIQDQYGKQFQNIKISYSVEDEPLGTGGAILKASKLCFTDEVLILNGDSIIQADLSDFLIAHRQSDSDFTIIGKEMSNFDRYGTLQIEGTRVIGFEEKKWKERGVINSGVYCLNLLKFNTLTFPLKFSFELDFIEVYVNQWSFNHWKSDGFFIDIGIPEDYLKAQKMLPQHFKIPS